MIIFFSTRSSDMLTSLPHWSNSLVFIQHTQCKFNVRKWVDEQWTKSVNSLQRSGFRANRRWFTDVVHVRDTCCAIVTGTILRNNAQLVSAIRSTSPRLARTVVNTNHVASIRMSGKQSKVYAVIRRTFTSSPVHRSLWKTIIRVCMCVNEITQKFVN